MRQYPSKNTHDATIQHVQEKYKQQIMNRVDIMYNYAILIKCVLRAVLNDVTHGERLTCSGKSFHNEDTAEANDLSSQDLLVLILLKRLINWLIAQHDTCKFITGHKTTCFSLYFVIYLIWKWFSFFRMENRSFCGIVKHT